MAKSRSVLELDLDPDVIIGLKLPLKHDDNKGFFPGHLTTIAQTSSNIKNLLLTRKGERVGQPEFGCDLLKVLFEPMSGILINQVEESIGEAIAVWLPHVTINKLLVEPDDSELNQLNVELEFSLAMNPEVHETITMNFLTGT